MSSITPSKLIRSRTSRRYVTLRTTLFFVAAFHTALKDGAADEILDSLRSSFNKAAQAFTQARTLIPADQPAEAFLHNAKPEAVTAWQALDGHLAGLDRIGAIGAAFGPRTGNFPLIDEYTLGDGFRLEDRALCCTNGQPRRPTAPRSGARHRGTAPVRGSGCRCGYTPSTRRGTATASGPRPVGTPARRTGGLRPRRKRPNARTAAAEKPL